MRTIKPCILLIQFPCHIPMPLTSCRWVFLILNLTPQSNLQIPMRVSAADSFRPAPPLPFSTSAFVFLVGGHSPAMEYRSPRKCQTGRRGRSCNPCTASSCDLSNIDRPCDSVLAFHSYHMIMYKLTEYFWCHLFDGSQNVKCTSSYIKK
jgi:hypothetical protein